MFKCFVCLFLFLLSWNPVVLESGPMTWTWWQPPWYTCFVLKSSTVNNISSVALTPNLPVKTKCGDFIMYSGDKRKFSTALAICYSTQNSFLNIRKLSPREYTHHWNIHKFHVNFHSYHLFQAKKIPGKF